MFVVPCRYGNFILPNYKDLIFDSMRKYGEWAQQEIDILSRFIRPGDKVIDAGSFIGTHTRAFSQIVGNEGKIYAFEPIQSSHEILVENVKNSPCANIVTYRVGLGAKTEAGFMLQNKGNLGQTKISKNYDNAMGIAVSIKCLDDFDFSEIDFIKADLEGMEYSMLIGAEKTVSRCQPIMFLEVNNLNESHLILEWVSVRGYMVFGVISEAFNPSNANGTNENIFGKSRECGLLLVPRFQFAALERSINALQLPLIDSLDGLALLLLHKPQYLIEVCGNTATVGALGLEIPTPNATALAEQLGFTERAKTIAEEIAHSNGSEIERLRGQLAATEDAKEIAETLALARYEELSELAQQLGFTEHAKTIAEEIAHSNGSEIVRLQVQLAATENAKEIAETLALARYEELMHLEKQFELSKNLIEKLRFELNRTNEYHAAMYNSIGYKVLKTLRLTKHCSDKDV